MHLPGKARAQSIEHHGFGSDHFPRQGCGQGGTLLILHELDSSLARAGSFVVPEARGHYRGINMTSLSLVARALRCCNYLGFRGTTASAGTKGQTLVPPSVSCPTILLSGRHGSPCRGKTRFTMGSGLLQRIVMRQRPLLVATHQDGCARDFRSARTLVSSTLATR